MHAAVFSFILGGAYIASGIMLARFVDTDELWWLLVSFVFVLIGSVALVAYTRKVAIDSTTAEAAPAVPPGTERETR